MGASVAHFLARKGFGRIVLLEARQLAAVSTGHSAANLRTYYSNPVTVKLALRSLEMFENDREELGGDCGFRQIGLLLLLDQPASLAAAPIFEMERAAGADVQSLSLQEMAEVAPQLDLSGLDGGLFEPRSGYADPLRTVENLVGSAGKWGLETETGVKVTGISRSGGRVQAVRTERGDIAAPVVVNAAGPWGLQVGKWVGLNDSIRWSRESDVIVRQPRGFGSMPVVSDPALRFYCRPHEGDTVLAGLGYPKEIEPLDIDSFSHTLDSATEGRILGSLEKRIPLLKGMPQTRGYASIYTITDDWHPLVGPCPDIEGYFACFGGSGHGFKLAPALGECLASMIAGEAPPIDIHAFRPSRFREGESFTSAWGSGNRG